MKAMIFVVSIFSGQFLYGQTDIEITNALLGQPYAQANAILSKMKVWYHHHYKDTKNIAGEDTKAKFYSIEDGDGVTKVWAIHYDKAMVINEIVINYRHDDKRQVESLQKVAAMANGHHIGTYSTDLVFRQKK